MQTEEHYIQLTFHYLNGEKETFNVYQPEKLEETSQERRLEIRRLLDKPWWIIHLPEETICIKTANLLRVEIKPPMSEIIGEDVFYGGYRVTALGRSPRTNYEV